MPRSAIREIMDLAAGREGVIHLEIGDPDLITPEHIIEASAAAARAGWTRYTQNAGLPSLREAIAEKVSARTGAAVSPACIVVTVGAVGGLYTAVMTVADAGDEVLVPDPGWPPYESALHLAGARAVRFPLKPENGFLPDVDEIDSLITDRTKAIMINSPGNPAGAMYPRETLRRIAGLADGYGIYVISDEIYEDIVFVDRGHVAPLALRPDLAERTCVISGLSKAFAMTGWRVGYSIAPLEWTRVINALQGHSTSNICAISQQAALAAVGHDELVRPMVEIFRQRRDRCMALLEDLPSLSAQTPEATFYLYLDATRVLATEGLPDTVDALADWLLHDHKLVLVPGSAFGDPKHLRMSFAAADEVLDEAFVRLAQALG